MKDALSDNLAYLGCLVVPALAAGLRHQKPTVYWISCSIVGIVQMLIWSYAFQAPGLREGFNVGLVPVVVLFIFEAMFPANWGPVVAALLGFICYWIALVLASIDWSRNWMAQS